MVTYRQWADLGEPVDLLMDCWLASLSDDPAEKEEYSWAFMVPAEESGPNPEKAWQCILVAATDSRFEDKHLGAMAAGALEDLLSFHGDAFIERVEDRARSNPRFAWMLGGVWQFQMTEAIWHRVQAVWDNRGWEGKAAEG